MIREGKRRRKTNETEVEATIVIDGRGKYEIDTGVPFLDHMLAQIARHGLFDLKVRARGDIEIDAHHTVEDIGITLGQAFKEAVGDGEGIQRFGSASVPLNEALSAVSLDVSGRPFLSYQVDLPKEKVGEFDVELVEEFFHAFVANSGITLHVRFVSGTNLHHIVESIFKSFARALDAATQLDPRVRDVPSTKGSL